MIKTKQVKYNKGKLLLALDVLVEENDWFLLDNELVCNCTLLTNEWCKSPVNKVIAASKQLQLNLPTLDEKKH